MAKQCKCDDCSASKVRSLCPYDQGTRDAYVEISIMCDEIVRRMDKRNETPP